MLKKAATGVPCLRRAYSAEVALATKAGSGYAQAGRHFAVLTYAMYAPRFKQGLSPSGYVKPFAVFSSTGSGHGWTDFFEHSLQLMMAISSWACICHGNEIFNIHHSYPAKYHSGWPHQERK
jgi:hypothetical protein